MTTPAALKILRSGDPAYSLGYAFPSVAPGIKPVGERLLVQIRRPNPMFGNLHKTEDTLHTELWNEQTAKVIAVGPLAFKKKDTLEPWPEGQWCEPGHYIRIPLHKNDKWSVDIPGQKGEFVLFATIRDIEVLGFIDGDPLVIKTLL